MKKYIVAGILFAATMLVSCGGLQSFTFDQLYPAEVTFPETSPHGGSSESCACHSFP